MRIQNQSWMAFANNRVQKNQSSITKTLEKLSGGDKIVRASMNASGLSVSESLRAQIKGLSRAQSNMQDGLSVLETTDSGLQNVNNTLQRIRELAVQSVNDTLSDKDREFVQEEVHQLMQSIDDTAKHMEFNTHKILGEIRPLYIQSGSGSGQTIAIDTFDVSTKKLGLEGSNLQTRKSASELISKLDSAITTISSHLTKVGANYNTLIQHSENVQQSEEGLQKAESLIRDPDIALEMMDFVKLGIVTKGSELLIQNVNRDTKSILGLFR